MNFHDFSALRWMLGDVDGLIKKGYISDESHSIRLLKILYMPSFDPIVNWEVFKVKNDNTMKYFIVKTYWDRAEDFKKFNSIQSKSRSNNPLSSAKPLDIKPTILGKLYDSNADFAENLISKLQNIRITPFPNSSPTGCDGTFYEISFQNSFHNLHIHWWEDGPENWSELTTFIKDLLNTFNQISSNSL
ncbi:hypothetical protein JHL18_06250 [Clostridium sp. YIM B02505]|uniref:Uncharacterized protein n=1 Tax=Clostridium yunnanense TaxID=2800325 RepID=A0ABS1ELK3_9CLOT|nr:hypothetical protein [Clostridium yunnanense]MBK1810237.1 hypothetical protein [Clostridium yunnanense]